MRTLCAIAICAASLSGAVGLAHAAGPSLPGPTRAPAAHIDDIQGQYTLKDGRVLTISGSAHRILAQLDGRPDTILVPLGGPAFKARDGSYQLVFEQSGNGNVVGVTLEETPAPHPVHS